MMTDNKHKRQEPLSNNAMTYRSVILATVSVRVSPRFPLLPLVRLSLSPPSPPLFISLSPTKVRPQRAQIRSQWSGAPFRCVRTGDGDPLPGSWDGGARLRHPRGWRGRVRRGRVEGAGEGMQAKGMEQFKTEGREETGEPAKKKRTAATGRQTPPESRQTAALSRLALALAHAHACSRTVAIIRGHGAPSPGGAWWDVVGSCLTRLMRRCTFR